MRDLFLLAGAICFIVAILTALGAFQTNYDAWLAGGLLAWELSVIIPAARERGYVVGR